MTALISVSIIAILIYLSYEDIKTQNVQLNLLIIATILAAVQTVIHILESGEGLGIKLFLITPGVLMLCTAIIRHERNIGIGDGITYIILGLMFDLPGFLCAVCFSNILILALCVPGLCMRKLRLTDNIPMIPFLTSGAMAGLICERILYL